MSSLRSSLAIAASLASWLGAAALPASARQVEVRWLPAGGTPAVGYVVYVGQASRSYGQSTDVGLPPPDGSGVRSALIAGLPDDRDLYVAVTAYSADDLESGFSNESVVRAIPTLPPPDPPVDPGDPPVPPVDPGDPPVTPPTTNVTVFQVEDGSPHALFDASESRVIDVAGHQIAYQADMDARGRIGGKGAADLDGDGGFETPFELHGKVKGAAPLLASKLKMKAKGEEETVKVLLRRHIDRENGTDVEEIVSSAKGPEGEALEEVQEQARAAEPGSQSWALSFWIHVDSEDVRKPVIGNLAFGGGRYVELAGQARLDEESGTWKLRLASSGDDRGVRFKLDEVVLSEDRTEVLSGEIVCNALGQQQRILLGSAAEAPPAPDPPLHGG